MNLESRKNRAAWLVAALILIATLRVVATYRTLSATMDEPDHIAAGMQWLDRGIYTYGYDHPPLARVFLAAGLYAKGVRSFGDDDMISEGNLILYTGHEHRLRLALARMGNLPFLVLGAVVVWLWGRRWFGAGAGLWAVLLFTSLPPVLAHAGVAALDMAATASCSLALYEMMRWREEPTMRRAAILGVAFAIAVLCKFSTPAFLIACAFIGIPGLWGANCPKLDFRPLWRQAAAMTGIVLLLLWAGYHFNIQRIVSPTEKQDFVRVLNQRVGQPAVIAMASRLADVPVPGGGLLRGFLELANHNAKGHPSYLLGRYSTAGFWDFFPVVLSVKTPIGFLLLALCGMAMVLYHFREAPWQHRVTALFPIAIFLVCMSSRINIGVRHILPIYVPMAVLAGHAATWLWAQWKTRWVAIALALWVVAASAMIHPDYLAYFNEIAGSHPEKIIVDSDLDWGQDLDRLSARMRELHIDHLGLRYFGNAPVSSAELPPYTILKPNEVTEGYVAISLRTRETDHAHDPTAWSWLYFRKPIERIGKSIDLYYITAENAK